MRYVANQNAVTYYNPWFAISLNNDLKKICICLSRQFIYEFKNVVSIDVEVDGSTIAPASIGGAIVGGLLFGGAGAIIGSASKKIEKKVKNIYFKITVDDINTPYHVLPFYQGFEMVDEKLPNIVKAQREVTEWYSRLLNIVEKNRSHVTVVSDLRHSLADELAKLNTLLLEGAISQVEFDAFKIKLLNN